VVTVTRSVRHGELTIAFDLVRTDRRTLGLTVHRDGRVVARAPRKAREADVLTWVAGHADWILRRRRDAAERELRTPPRRFTDGETHLYLGREYRLTVERGETERVRLGDGEFRVSVADDAAPGRVEELMDAWYMRQARRRLPERLDACWRSFPAGDRPRPLLRVRRMRSRWGSMSPRSSMSLRVDLIRAPEECIDYVIVHELCHLVHPNHGREFWAMVEKLVPDWKDRKRRLELTLV
jgi:predicted metal-dependent hydrolase